MGTQFEDEFEEFRARANSGGLLPMTHAQARRLVLQKRAKQRKQDLAKRGTSLNDAATSLTALFSTERSPHAHHSPLGYNIANETCDDGMRPRVSSMPSSSSNRSSISHSRHTLKLEKHHPRDLPPICTHHIRSFNITARGRLLRNEDMVVSHAISDGHLSRRFEDNITCTCRSCSCLLVTSDTPIFSSLHGSSCSVHSPNNAVYRVLVVGKCAVGKSSMLRKFAEGCTDIYTVSSFDEEGEKSVSILLDGEESTLEFVDLADEEMGSLTGNEQMDAYVVVYSVEDRRSFEAAIDRLYEIRQDETKEVAVILVANKTDLVRTRVIFELEGTAAAHTYNCKYIEVSAAIDHKIDELLVGILKQIRLIKELRGPTCRETHTHHTNTHKHSHKHDADGDKHSTAHSSSSTKFCCPLRVKNSVIEKLFGRSKRGAKSCENLYVL